jgi:hypothetical protein
MDMTDALTSQTISPAAYVIGKLGGLTKAANKLGKAVTTVQGWRDRERIPQDHWSAIIDVAAAEGVAIELADFLKEHEEEDRAA